MPVGRDYEDDPDFYRDKCRLRASAHIEIPYSEIMGKQVKRYFYFCRSSRRDYGKTEQLKIIS